MNTIEQLQLETENWQLKGALVNAQQALMQYQAKEINENLSRLAVELAAAQSVANPQTEAHD